MASENINMQLASLEMEALSLLLHFWSEPDNVEKRIEKIDAFRKAVIAGIGRSKSEKHVPRELAYSEYKSILYALRYLKKKCKKDDPVEIQKNLQGILIPYEINGCEYEKPTPLCTSTVENDLKALLCGTEEVSRIAYRIVGVRLGCGAGQVKVSTFKSKIKRVQLSELQQLLISVFLDLCSEPKDKLRFDALVNILNWLFRLETHVLIIYYLIQRAHLVVGESLFTGEYDFNELQVLYDSVCGDSDTDEFDASLSYRPFMRLL